MPRRAGPSRAPAGGGWGPPPQRSYSPTSQSGGSSQPQQKQPGLFKQSAAIAGGVATGTVVGHAIGSALTGGSRYREREGEYSADQMQQPHDQDPCAKEIAAFLKCSQEQKDISICEGFNEAIKQCRKYGSSALSEKPK